MSCFQGANTPNGTALPGKRRDLCVSLLWHALVDECDYREPEQPQGVLIRAGAVHNGPAKLTKYLQVDKHFNGDSFITCPELWIAEDGYCPSCAQMFGLVLTMPGNTGRADPGAGLTTPMRKRE